MLMSWTRLHEFCGLRPDAGGRKMLQGFAPGRGRQLHVPLHPRACGLRPWTMSSPEGACTCAMLGMSGEAHVDKVIALARWLLHAAARCTVKAQCWRVVPAELKTKSRVARGKTYIHECVREEQETIAAAKYDSKTNDECSSQYSAAGSQQPTANSKQPPGGASDGGGGDDDG